MTISYNLLPIPKWYFADFSGKPLGGGFMLARSSLDPTVNKVVFQDAGGTLAWPTQTITIGQVQFDDAILWGANGEQGPFFWQFNTASPNDLYFIQIYDSDGNIQFSQNNYGAPGGSGGGGTITNVNNPENYINNNVFWRNQGTLNNIQGGTVIAPANHEGLVAGSSGFNTIPFVGPDIIYTQNNNSSTNNLSFATADFILGSNPLTGDITPEVYIDLQCTVAGTEALKAVQFPVDLHVKNLEGQSMTAIIWAKPVAGNANLTMNFVQYFGTGSATTPHVTVIPIGASPLSAGWNAYAASFVVPTNGGSAIGAGGDDASYLQVNFPVADTFHTYITKPKLYLGTAVTQVFPELQTYDKIEAIINSPRTGDTRTSMNSFAPYGWVAMNDGTIGSASSNATTRANIDTWPLYSLLWSATTNATCPSFTSAGVLSSRGASAIADFGNNVQLSVPKALGRVLAGANPSALGIQKFIPPASVTNSGGSILLTVDDTSPFYTGTQVTFTAGGGALPTNLVVATPYFLTVINSTTMKISTSLANAVAAVPTFIAYVDSGTGPTNSFTTTVATHLLGSFVGEDTHADTVAEMPSHLHQSLSGSNFVTVAGGGSVFAPATGTDGSVVPTTANTGGSTAHNNLQPTTYMNIFIKL